MRCSCKAQCPAHCKHVMSISLVFPFPLEYQCGHLEGTFSLKGHLHKMMISNSPPQWGTAWKEISKMCMVVEERTTCSVRIPNVETMGYVRSLSMRTWKEVRMFLVLKPWGLQLSSQLYGFLKTSKNNSPYFLTNAYWDRALMNLPLVCPSCDLWLTIFKIFPISIFKSRHESRLKPSSYF